jgi:hypothetical protein
VNITLPIQSVEESQEKAVKVKNGSKSSKEGQSNSNSNRGEG